MNTVSRRPCHVKSNVPGIIGFALAIALACTTLALAAQVAPEDSTEDVPARADRILLDAAAPSGQGELPPVPFDHDAHTKALIARGQDCTSCHEPYSGGKEGRLAYSFKSTTEKRNGKNGPDYVALKTTYHDGCISCHDDLHSEGVASGPIEPECRSCHATSGPLPKLADGGLDPSLHFFHYTSPAVIGEGANPYDKCATCHHNGQPLSSPMLRYDSCRSCHGTDGELKKGPSYADMAHYRCISCHLETAAKTSGRDLTAGGPVLCADCHDTGAKVQYPTYDTLPRLRAGQPYAVVMSGGDAPAGQGLMDPVVFDHALHERANPNCISCHTQSMAEYGSGGNRTQDQLVHDLRDPASCVGCHETIKTTRVECAGCHTPHAALSQADCALCHQPLSGPLPDSDKTLADLAKKVVNARRAERAETDRSAVPETVHIGLLSNEYNPADFPHGEHIRRLAEGLDAKAPAFAALHAANYTLCQSCHHNSPASPTPPNCVSCHAKEQPFGTLPADGRPVLKIAYHQQCMSCHQRMGIQHPAATECSTCHTQRAPAS